MREFPIASIHPRATKTLRGAQSYAVFKRAIDELVAEAAKGS